MIVAKIHGKNFDPVFEIDEQGSKDLLDTLQIVNGIESSCFILSDILLMNINDLYLNMNSIVKKVAEKGTDFLIDSSEYRSNSSKIIMNILTSFYSYTEISPKLIMKYLKNKSIADKFENEISLHENNSFEYRFIRKFRNYVQHNNLPFSDINIDFLFKDIDRIFGVIQLDRDELLSNGRWKAKADKYDIVKEINSLPKTFLLEPIINVFRQNIIEIHMNVLSLVIDVFSDHLTSLFSLYEDAKKAGNESHFGLLVPNKSKTETTIHIFNTPFMNRLRSMIEEVPKKI